jgi:dipeptidyl aminopeptidase/acylaminoacyl peptidase
MRFLACSAGMVRAVAATAVALVLVGTPELHGQSAVLHQEGYLAPPDHVAQAVTAPRHENVTLSNLSPSGEAFLNSVGDGMPPIAALARTYYRLGGVEIDPVAQRSRNMTTRGNVGLQLISPEDGSVRSIDTPAGARAGSTAWSPDGSMLAFVANYATESHVYVADAASGQSRRVTTTPLLATRVGSVDWSGDGRYLFAVVRPANQGPAPVEPAAPPTPLIRITSEEENSLRTYASLLRDPHEQELLEYYTTGQLVRIPVATGTEEPIGGPAMIQSVSASPDGNLVRVRTMQRPFSYIVPASMFGSVDEIWDLNGNVLFEVGRQALRDGSGSPDDDDDAPERRQLTWRPDGQGLSFLQREPEADEGEERNNNTRMDRVMQWLPPFEEGTEQIVYESERQIRSVRYSADASVLFLTERNRNTDRLYAVFLDDPTETYTISEEDTEDWYDSPGSLMSTSNELGASVVRMSSDGAYVYLSGTEHSEDPLEQAPRPFVDRVEIRTGETERVFQSAEDAFERVTTVLDDDLSRLVVIRESPTTVPDSWRLDVASGNLTRLTHNVDHTPDITAARREVMDVTRPDGHTFRVRVTLPADWDGEPLPAMFWHYPREYDDQEAYDRSLRTYNKNRFPSIGVRSMDILVRHGYAVVDHDHPTFGPRATVNNSFIPDLRMNLLTVIDAVSERGWVDRRRLALGGHSYGGFGTIHALVQTPYFRAGIAGAPNSNRLLTPLGFQTERRSLWEARETYLEMSPFLWAERMNGALLIYHGEDDQNTGTFPENSWRLIHALNGLGKTAALYMYPYEGHGQVAEETLLDMWARWVAWLDHYVKDADVTQPVAPVTVEDQDMDMLDRQER